MADSSSKPSEGRRSFLKIGAGFVAGAVVVGAGVAAYESSVIGSNNSSSSSAVSSLNDELAATQSQLSDTQNSLTAANNTISSLNGQLSAAQGSLSNANSQLSAATSSNANLSTQLNATQNSLSSANSQVASLQGTVSSQSSAISGLQKQVATANSQITSANSQLSSANAQVSTLQGQVSSLQTAVTSANSNASTLQAQVDNYRAYQILTPAEVILVNAIASTFIPTDSNGAGGTQAGCSYFIDGQLAGKYGTSGHMYMQGPFIFHDLTTPVTPNVAPRIYTAANGNVYTTGTNTSFSAGTMKTVPDNGMRYQYNFNLRYYWHLGLEALETYSNTAYGANFESLSSANQVKALQDLYNNVPTQTQFNDILPADFFYELFFMVYSGFTVDPMYGGNIGMVGWLLTANNGVNMGNFYGEGYTTKQIMVSSSPPILKPASLGQFQKGSP